MSQAGSNQFWLPTIMIADARINGDFEPPPGAGKKWMNGLQIDEALMLAFLESITPALRALLMAGYKVPYIDIGFENLSGFDNVFNPGGISRDYFRIDLENRAFSMQSRAVEDNAQLEGRSVVKLKLVEISNPTGVGAVDLSVERFNTFISEYPDEYDDAALNGSFQEFLDAKFGAGTVSASRDVDATIFQYRERIVSKMVYDMSLYDGVASIPIDIGYASSNQAGPLVRQTLFEAIRIGVFDSIRWYVGSLLMKATETSYLDHETALEDNSLSSEALHKLQAAGPALPGMLWALNPYYWDQLTKSSTFSDADLTRLDALKWQCQTIWGTLGSTRRDWYSDYLNISQTEGINTDDSYSGFKTVDLLHASAFDKSLIYQQGETPAQINSTFLHREPLLKFIEQQLVAPDIYSEEIVKKGNKNKTEPEYALNPSFIGTVRQYAGLPFDEGDPFAKFATNIWLNAANFGDDYARLIQSLNAGLFDFGQGRSVVKRLQYQPYFDMVFSMFNVGIFSIQHITGDLSIRVDRARIYAESGGDASPNLMVLHHTAYPDSQGVRLRLVSNLGFSLEDSIAWEFIPAPPRAETLALRQALETSQPELAQQLSAQSDRLILVLAPGVSVNDMLDWPTTCPVEIYRVQSHGQVPGDGETINTDILEAPITIMAFDDLDPMEGETRSLDPFIPLFTAQPELHPTVTIKPLRKGRLCGVTISTMPQGGNFNRGVNGKAEVELIFDSHSGDARFAIDLRYRIMERTRAVDTESREVMHFRRQFGDVFTTVVIDEIDGIASVIQFELIIHKTSNILINIKDNNIGLVADWLPEILYGDEVDFTFVYSLFEGDIRAILPDGHVLPTTMSEILSLPNASEPAIPWQLVRDNGPIDRANTAVMIDAGRNVIDIGVGFIPVVGDGVDAVELLIALATDRDRWGRPVTNLQKAIMFGCVLLPFVSTSMFRALKATPVGTTGDTGGQLFASVLENHSKGR